MPHLLQSQDLHIPAFMGLPDIDDTSEVIGVSQSLYELIEDLVSVVVLPVHGVVGSSPRHPPLSAGSGLLYQPLDILHHGREADTLTLQPRLHTFHLIPGDENVGRLPRGRLSPEVQFSLQHDLPQQVAGGDVQLGRSQHLNQQLAGRAFPRLSST